MNDIISKIDILGSQYTVCKPDKKHKAKMTDNVGLCEFFTKTIYIDFDRKDSEYMWDNPKDYYAKVLRHEILHAILGECGDSEYMIDERLVEKFAVLYPKIAKIMKYAESIIDNWYLN